MRQITSLETNRVTTARTIHILLPVANANRSIKHLRGWTFELYRRIGACLNGKFFTFCSFYYRIRVSIFAARVDTFGLFWPVTSALSCIKYEIVGAHFYHWVSAGRHGEISTTRTCYNSVCDSIRQAEITDWNYKK